ncbi:MAG TPA: MFS transporter [Phycisphaerales bacterium]|nr:MFS transporter [Phycisphaerales bacterium]
MTADGVLYSYMVGTGETYFAAFALAIGLGEVLAGLVASVPLVTGALLQLVSPWAVARLGSLRRWVVICATVQSLSFLPLAVGAVVGAMPAWLLFLVVAVYWAVNYGQGPAWNTWVTTLVPRRIRARYFANRSRVAQFGTLGGLVFGGVVLHAVKGSSNAVHAYAALFLAAAAARFAASRCIAGQREPVPIPPDFRLVGWREMASRWRHGHDARLLTYMLAMQVAVQISGPYFTPYMLARLEFSYAQFMLLVSVSFVARSICLPYIGRLAHALGPRAVLWIGGVGILPLSALWIVSDNYWYLVATQVLAGAMWACYEMATFLLLFETIPASERTSVLTLFNFANALAIVGGALVGAAVLTLFHAEPWVYFLIFGLSFAARVCTVPLLARVRVPEFEPVDLPLRPIAVRPSAGSLDRPVLAGIDAETPAPGEPGKAGDPAVVP